MSMFIFLGFFTLRLVEMTQFQQIHKTILEEESKSTQKVPLCENVSGTSRLDKVVSFC